MAQGYYQSSLYKKKCVNVSAMLCILNKILYIFKIIMCYVELTRGVVIFEWMGPGNERKTCSTGIVFAHKML